MKEKLLKICLIIELALNICPFKKLYSITWPTLLRIFWKIVQNLRLHFIHLCTSAIAFQTLYQAIVKKYIFFYNTYYKRKSFLSWGNSSELLGEIFTLKCPKIAIFWGAFKNYVDHFCPDLTTYLHLVDMFSK